MWDLFVTGASLALCDAFLRSRVISIVRDFSKKEAQAKLQVHFRRGHDLRQEEWSSPRDDFKDRSGDKVGSSATR